MSVTLTGSEGFFTRNGAWVGEYNRVAALYGSATDTGFQSIWSQYASSDQAAVQSLPDAVTAFRQTGISYQNTLVADGSQSMLLQVGRDQSVIPPTLARAIQIVADQMDATSQSINRPTLGTTVTDGASNLGDTKFAVSTTNIYGDPLDMTLTETFTATCTSQSSGFSASFSVVGENAVPPNSWNWPQGSGASATVQVTDPAVDGIVTGGQFVFTTVNVPDDWTILNGAAGTTVFQSVAGGVRTGTDAVYLQSDGSSATKVAQAVTLSTNTVYAVTFQAKMNSNSASGTLVVQLYDATNGVVLTNDAGTNLQASYNLNGGAGEITTSYQLLTVFFSTPRQLPASVQIRIGYGTAGVSTRQLFLDLVQIVAATPLYGLANTGTSGPFVAAIANTTPSAVADTYSLAFTNSLNTRSFALGMERLFSLREIGVYLPSSGSPTISDSLVTQ